MTDERNMKLRGVILGTGLGLVVAGITSGIVNRKSTDKNATLLTLGFVISAGVLFGASFLVPSPK